MNSSRSRERLGRCARPFHESATIHLLRGVLIVRPAKQADAIGSVEMRSRKPLHMIEFQGASLGAPPSAVVGESAATTHDPTHLLLTRRGCDRTPPCAHVEMLRWSTCRKRWAARAS